MLQIYYTPKLGGDGLKNMQKKQAVSHLD